MIVFSWSHIKNVVERHYITYGVIAALLIASLLTAISMALYVSSGASRLDLSRPGYERVRGDVQSESEDSRFSSNGPIDVGVIKDFQARFNKHRSTLEKLDNFSAGALDDTELQIAPDSQ